MKNLIPVVMTVLLGFIAVSAGFAQDSARYENEWLRIEGSGFTVETLNNGVKAYSNRDYVYKNVPDELAGAKFTRVAGGEWLKNSIRVTALKDTVFFVVKYTQTDENFSKSFELISLNAFCYTDAGMSQMKLYRVSLTRGQTIDVPQTCWTGSQVIFGDSPLAYNPPRMKLSLQRMLYNNPGLLDDLAVGLWSWPIPVDFNNDGRMDLIVNCDDTPYNGVYRFAALPSNGANSSDGAVSGCAVAQFSSRVQPNPSTPVFKPGERISRGMINVEASFIDGKTHVLRPAQAYPDFADSGLNKPEPLPIPANVHKNNLRGNFWKYVDFNGDGKMDVIIGTDDWTPYGWANAYDEKGVWKNDQSHGNIYVVINHGTTTAPEYDKPYMLQLCTGKPLMTYGWPSPSFEDFDGDGDLDILCGEFRDSLIYFANIGTSTAPAYAPGVFVKCDSGRLANQVECMVTPVVCDWNKDGKFDVICGNEDGRICYYENTGRFNNETVSVSETGTEGGSRTIQVPVFKEAVYFQQQAYELKAGSLCTPWCCDLNGDGAIDIVAGNSAGNIQYFRNLSPAGEEFPKWDRPTYLTARKTATNPSAVKADFPTTVADPDAPDSDYGVITIIARPNGSIQGPIEDKYGYTTLTVADWDGDGLLDMMVSSVLGKVGVFRNIGTKTAPQFDAFEPVEVQWPGSQPTLAWGWVKPNGNQLLTQWRTTPVMYDWNDDGLMDLCMLDVEGYFSFFERYRNAAGELLLKAPQRIFCLEDGQPLRLNGGTAGASGRRKICFTDWDGDGRVDIITNSINADLYRNVRSENGKTYFKHLGKLDDRRLAGHTTSPTPADFNNDGITDLVIGAEDGRFYYLRNPNTK